MSLSLPQKVPLWGIQGAAFKFAFSAKNHYIIGIDTRFIIFRAKQGNEFAPGWLCS